jgi:6-phosphogluconolactonase
MLSEQCKIRVLSDAAKLAAEAAGEFIRLSSAAIESKGRFTVALSGGSTPRRLYSMLSGEASFRDHIAWDRIHFFWGDERHVPPGHPDSNYRMANEAMLSKVPVRPENVHRMEGEDPDPDRAAREYEEKLRRITQVKVGEIPRLDLALLGMGADGHTASLFPGSRGIEEQERLVIANWVESLKTFRITMTFPLLNHAAFLLLLVSGEDKAETLRAVFEESGEDFPVQRIRPTGGCLWLVDRRAAMYLKQK